MYSPPPPKSGGNISDVTSTLIDEGVPQQTTLNRDGHGADEPRTSPDLVHAVASSVPVESARIAVRTQVLLD